MFHWSVVRKLRQFIWTPLYYQDCIVLPKNSGNNFWLPFPNCMLRILRCEDILCRKAGVLKVLSIGSWKILVYSKLVRALILMATEIRKYCLLVIHTLPEDVAACIRCRKHNPVFRFRQYTSMCSHYRNLPIPHKWVLVLPARFLHKRWWSSWTTYTPPHNW